MQLREDWRNAKKFISIWAASGQAAFLVTWAALPADLKVYIPTWIGTTIALGLIALGVFGVMVKQKGLSDDPQ